MFVLAAGAPDIENTLTRFIVYILTLLLSLLSTACCCRDVICPQWLSGCISAALHAELFPSQLSILQSSWGIWSFKVLLLFVSSAGVAGVHLICSTFIRKVLGLMGVCDWMIG
jgi:hypothetical protein